MKTKNFLSDLRSLFRGSQKDEGRTRLRLVIDSFTRRLRVSPHLGCIFAALFLVLGVGIARGATTVTFTFNTDAGLSALGIKKPDSGKGTELTANSPYTLTPVSMSVTHGGSTNTRVWNSSGSTTLRTYISNSKHATITFSVSSSYYLTQVVFSGGTNWSANSGSYSSGTWTKANNAEPTSVIFTSSSGNTITTIAVTYETATPADPYTVSFSTGTGNPTQADITEASAGAGVTLPAGPTPACSSDGWSFAGWKETSAQSSASAPSSKLWQAGETYSPAANTTLYAVYFKASGNDYQYIDNINSLFDGAKMIITAYNSEEYTEYAVSNTTDGDGYIYSSSVSPDGDDVISSPANSIVWTLKGYKDSWTLKNVGNNKYIIVSTRPALADASENVSITYEVDEDDYDQFNIQNGTKYLYMWADNTFSGYNKTYLYLYQQQGTYNTNPSCAACDTDPTIGDASLNGSFNMTSTTSAIGVSSGTCAPGTSCSWADYGFVWSDGTDTKTPTVSNNKVQVGTSGTATSWTGSVTPSGSTSPSSWTTGHTYYVCTYGKNNKAGAAFTYGSAWSFTPQSVTFKANGGTGDDKVQYLRKSTSTALTANTFTKVGHDFAGWATSSSGSVVYADGASVNIDADLILHAKWSPKDYTITTTLSNCSWSSAISSPYTYDGATNSITRTVNPSAGYGCPSTITVTMGGSTLTVSTDYTWSVTNGVGSFTLKKAITGNVAITITAQPMVTWSAGGKVFSTQTGAANTALTNPGTPSNSTYCDGTKIFVGWSASQIDGTTDTEPSDLFSSAEATSLKIPASGTTYYAVFATVSGTYGKYKRVTSSSASTDIAAGQYIAIVAYNSHSNYQSWQMLGVTAAKNGYDYTTAPSEFSSQIDEPDRRWLWKISKTSGYWVFNSKHSTSKKIATYGNTSTSELNWSTQTYYKWEYGSNSSEDNTFYLRLYDNTNLTNCGLERYNAKWQIYYTADYVYNTNAAFKMKFYVPAYTLSAYATLCCATNVSLSHNSPSNGTVAFSRSTTPTCDEDKTVTMTITPSSGYQLTGFSVATGDGYVAAKSTSPAVATNNNSNAAQEITLTFAEDEDGEYAVTATFGLMTPTALAWTYNSAAIPNPINLYVGQTAQLDATYTPSGLANSQQDYTIEKNAAFTQVTKVYSGANPYYTFRADATVDDGTVVLTNKVNTSLATTVHVHVDPLPKVHFVDHIQNQSFDDVEEEIVDNELSGTKTTPTHSDVSAPVGGNSCETSHLHLIGWIRSDCPAVDAYMSGTGAKPGNTAITSAGNDGSGRAYFFAPNASINVETFNGLTFYAVWAKVE